MKEFLKNKFLLAGILVSIFVAGFLSFYASSSPDGLEKVAEDKGFLDTAQESVNSGSVLSDYGIAGIDNERLSVGLSGLIGVVVTLVLSLVIFKSLARKK
jgi:cobalt/nickel transport protein